MNLTHS